MGAAFFVPPGSGLAGPAIVVVWGLGGAVLALIASAVTVKRLEPHGLRRALVLAGAIVAAIVVWIGFQLSVVQAQSTTPPQQSPERIDLLTFAQGAVPVSIGGSGATLSARLSETAHRRRHPSRATFAASGRAVAYRGTAAGRAPRHRLLRSRGQLTGTVTGNILRATGVAQVNRIPSAFILNVGGDGGMRGVRSTNGGPFALLW